ncbi:recombinase RecR [Corynebacterium sphenisci DSM 44792]|uniref:Recombination protein RecR n=1 Tax=Corynebacterium sphenisci DSM 44792 TaxID=1437874 RepID=A0A1L7CVE2_9CORY|nr:recombination mediator RecR [Corynebacterium sphenisci]APT89839.1 recombinase RecR [Corynebacterium sphenisci DSM 44792]MDO5730983.1 recombination mediator RecR [Corynebacterium sphenisci]
MFEGPLQDLIDELARLPGVGPKSAQRIAFHLLKVEPEDISRLQAALGAVRGGIRFCRICGNIAEEEVCRYCADRRRDAGLICVVEEARDIQALERTGEFRGRYHVLGGALDPLGGVGPNELNIRTLLQRIGGVLPDIPTVDDPAATEPAPEIHEVIIATDPNTEGEATSTYLAKLLRDFPGLRVTRLASGMPLGGDLEFVDELTLSRALTGRLSVL